MNEGNITVVDVIATDDGYQLSRPAQDLYIAYEVVRRHIDSDGVRHYAQMSSAKITDDGYEFKFETGDVFTCASHEDRPASATVSDAIAGGSAAEDEPLIGEKTVFSGVLGAYESLVPLGKACLLPDEWAAVSASLTDDELASIIVYVDGSTGNVSSPYMLSFDEQHVANTAASDVGKPVEIKIPAISPALINLYDPDSSDTETYYPDGAYDSDEGVFVLDVSAAYERLKRGQNVWIRWYIPANDRVHVEQVLNYAVENDILICSTWSMDGSWEFTNYTGSEPEISPQPDPGE